METADTGNIEDCLAFILYCSVVNLFAVEQYRTRRRTTTTTVTAQSKNFNKTRTTSAAICRQLDILEHVTFQGRHEYHRRHVGQGR